MKTMLTVIVSILSLIEAVSMAGEIAYKVPAEESLKNGRRVTGRASIRMGNENGVVSMQVTVSPEGTVESVTHLDGPTHALKKAAIAEKQLHFEPFIHNGKAVRATFRDAVSIYPEEKWGVRTAFPAVSNWHTLKVAMERRDWCDQPRCVSYKVEVSGSGIVRFTGTGWGSSPPTSFTGKLTHEGVDQLMNEFRQADFFSMSEAYVYPVTDATGTVLTVSLDGQTKTVHEWAGLAAGAPDALFNLERSIDQMAISNGWLDSRQLSK